jgi:hypothetical protein
VRPSTLFIAILSLTGCAPTAAEVASVTEPVLSSAASQVKRCYRAPRVSHAGRQIVTIVRMTSLGYPDGLPRVVSQQGVTPANSAFAERMAQAAIVAVVRCAPFNLPADLYEQGWQEFELTFSPVAAA